MSLVPHWSHPKQKLSCCLAIQASLRVPVSNKWWWGEEGGTWVAWAVLHLCSLLARLTAWAGRIISAVVAEITRAFSQDELTSRWLFFRQLQGVPSVGAHRHAVGELPSPVPWASRAATPWSVHYKFLKQVARVLQNIALPFYFICLFPFVPGILISRAVECVKCS